MDNVKLKIILKGEIFIYLKLKYDKWNNIFAHFTSKVLVKEQKNILNFLIIYNFYLKILFLALKIVFNTESLFCLFFCFFF